MRTIYLDCGMGAAGDMLMAALLELCPEKQEEFLGKMNGLGLPGVKVEAEPAVKCGITGTHMNVTVFGEEEESEDVHDHGHAHTHSHEACEPIAADGFTAMPTATMVMITTMRTTMPTAMPITTVTTSTATTDMITPTITIITPPWQASPPSLTVWIFRPR